MGGFWRVAEVEADRLEERPEREAAARAEDEGLAGFLNWEDGSGCEAGLGRDLREPRDGLGFMTAGGRWGVLGTGFGSGLGTGRREGRGMAEGRAADGTGTVDEGSIGG